MPPTDSTPQRPPSKRPALEGLLLASGGPQAAALFRAAAALGVRVASASGPVDDESSAMAATAVESPDLVELAARHGCAAVAAPGRGARESAILARTAREGGLRFVGPTPEALDEMADLPRLLERIASAGVRVVPHERVTDASSLRDAAERLGWPLKLVHEVGASALDEGAPMAEASSIASAAHAIGSTAIAVPSWPRARRLEVTTVADAHGNVVGLPERETSGRTEGGVLLTETPAPALCPQPQRALLRGSLADAACRVTSELGIRGAIATVEFVLDDRSNAHVAAVRPGPGETALATELLLGISPWELALRATRGEVVDAPPRVVSGHVVMATVWLAPRAEQEQGDPPASRMPTRWPRVPPGKVRVEPCGEVGAATADGRRPLVRIAARGQVRHQAWLLLDRVLAEVSFGDSVTNVAELRRALGHEAFRAGRYDVGFFERLR
ncbi:MAG: hypothetical protein NZ898_14190 [Myxococcota bacterium]|nr:hypothetical protein [Myxococcota bacterium]MDW8362207.1 hypothetical protein [Myxococcales bacterium]